MARLIAALFSLVLIAGVAAIAAYAWIASQFSTAVPRAAPVTLVIEKGQSGAAIAEALARAELIRDPLMFRIGARLFAPDQTLKAGEYAFLPADTPEDVLNKLTAGDVVVHKVTVPEGLTSAEIVAVLAETAALDGPVPPPPPEGSLLPETYHFERGETRAGLLARMAAAMTATLEALWPDRAGNLPFATPDEALVLASIVERETALAAEKPHIAGVFVNRLRRGMRLQSDPTVIYGLSDGSGRLDRPLTRADLEADHPYNTYRITGLPPHPIANPGRDSIAAVLNPLETADLYFVADGTGGHAFARTLEQHNRNVARWRRLQRSQSE